VPGLYNELNGAIPDYLKEHWIPIIFMAYFCVWTRHFERSGIFEVDFADSYADKEGIRNVPELGRILGVNDELVEADSGRTITFVRADRAKI
jgi:hypothetical protein